MTRPCALALAVLLGVIVLLPAPSARSADDPGAEIARLLQVLDTAFEKQDAGTLRNLMTADKLAITPYYDGPQTKEQQIASLPDLKMTEYTPGKMKTTVLSKDVLLVTYPLTMKGTFNGRPLPAHSHASSLWVHRDGRWQEAFYQETAQPEK